MSGNPLFLLSFRQRDELAATAERAGWTPIAARRADRAARRFILSGSPIAVVDARGAFEEGVAAVKARADPVEANAGALLVLLSRNDVPNIDAMYASGATHYLASPFGEQEFSQALRFAERYTVRLGRSFRDWKTAAGRGARGALDWRLDAQSGLVEIGAGLVELLGLPTAALPCEDFLERLGAEGAKQGKEALARLTRTGETTAFAHVREGSGGERLVHHLSLGPDGVFARIEQPDLNVETRTIERRDPLTGLSDAALGRQWIDERLGASGREGAKLALLMLALHRFDMINASFGRVSGDAVLQGVARRIERLVGASSGRKRLIARIAGAEFLVGLSPPTSGKEAEFLARQLVDTIEQPFVSGDQVIRLKARCGIVLGGEEDEDAAAVLRRASAALAETRESEPIRLHGKREEDEAARASRLEIDLRPAIEHAEIDILFQPQVGVTSGAITGVEALARWRHPAYGELGAAALFAAAERSDYLAELSVHVQAKALTTAAAWPEALGALRLSLNVTAAEMAEAGFSERFCRMVDETGFPRSRVTVEVTESGLIEDLGGAAIQLAALRAEGFRVAIDDFGTGYSSLAYLKSLPLDYLKIDRRLSQDIAGSPRDRVVVTGVVEMARSLGITVIAEGVETEEQLALLAESGCSLYQGYYCSPPIDSPALARLVTGRS